MNNNNNTNNKIILITIKKVKLPIEKLLKAQLFQSNYYYYYYKLQKMLNHFP